MKIKNILTSLSGVAKKIAEKPLTPTARRGERIFPKVVQRSVSRTRQDIGDWKAALRSADSIDNPRRAQLIRLYKAILLDSLLSSQIELRFQPTIAAPFHILCKDEIDEELTASLSAASWVLELNRHILHKVLFGHSLVELGTAPNGGLSVTLLPRTHVVPEKGMVLLNEQDSAGILYRDTREYGSWLLEFGTSDDYGLLNRTVPHVLFKRFAQSCWSELCEIYGIPPRYIKTNTQDDAMMGRAENMMRDMGAAAWFIIDQEEEFNFAKGADTNGDVYKNLISLCNNEISLLVSGAVVGQDTVNGNRSKEEIGIQLQDKLVQADRRLLTMAWNDIVIPALTSIGMLPEGCRFELQPEEDPEKRWKMIIDLLPYKDVDNDWIRENYGIEVRDKAPAIPQLSAESKDGFF